MASTLMTAKAIGGRGVLPRLQKVLCFQCINSTCYHSPTSHPMRPINISKGAGGVGHRNVWFGFAVHQFAESPSVGRQSMSRSAPHFRSRPTVPSFDATALDSHKALRSAPRATFIMKVSWGGDQRPSCSSKDGARRIAANIAKVPGLLQRSTSKD
jgi:hypothetical protein